MKGRSSGLPFLWLGVTEILDRIAGVLELKEFY